MKRRLVIILYIMCILTAAIAVGKPLQRMIFQNSEFRIGGLAGWEPAANGKGIRYPKVEKVMTTSIDLSKQAEEEKKQKQEEEKREAYIAECIGKMTLEQKLAQMMILTNEKDITKNNIERYQPGGIILFGVDFTGKTIQEVKERVDKLQSYADLPLFIGVDEEGGVVSRVSGLKEENLPVFKSVRSLYQEGGITAIKEEAVVKAELLKKMGINLNFDPVADIVTDSRAYMYDRSAAGSAKQVSEYVETVILTMQEEEIGSCLKHFPGYGNNVNTHLEFATDTKELSSYRKEDFLPFQAGIAQKADMVMVSHIVMKAVDEKKPASLSEKVHELLRNELNFSGVVIADDLNMRAILNRMSIKEATAKALIAGNDMIFSADFEESMKGAAEAVEQGELTKQQIDESVARVLRMKWNRRLIVWNGSKN